MLKDLSKWLSEVGTLTINLLDNRVFWDHDKVYQSSKSMKDTYLDLMSYFINNVLEQKASFNDVE